MVRSDIVGYVEKAEGKGASPEDIRRILVRAGHSPVVVEEAMLYVHRRQRMGTKRKVKVHPVISFFFVPIIVVVIIVGVLTMTEVKDAEGGDVDVVDGGVVDGNVHSTEYFLNKVDASDSAYTEKEIEYCSSLEDVDERIICSETAMGLLPQRLR